MTLINPDKKDKETMRILDNGGFVIFEEKIIKQSKVDVYNIGKTNGLLATTPDIIQKEKTKIFISRMEEKIGTDLSYFY